jgi:hypothetical protein
MQRIKLFAAPLALIMGICAADVQGAPRRPAPPVSQTRVANTGIMNPSQMVITPMGIMHRSTAIRLGLPFTPMPTGGGDGGTLPNPLPTR